MVLPLKRTKYYDAVVIQMSTQSKCSRCSLMHLHAVLRVPFLGCVPGRRQIQLNIFIGNTAFDTANRHQDPCV